LNNFPKISDSN